MSRSSQWCFTVNNYTNEHIAYLRALAEQDRTTYIVWGKETAPTTGTPHLQGFILFSIRIRFSTIRNTLNAHLPHPHIERAITREQAAIYCKKDGDFEEHGVLPASNPGRRVDRDDFIKWCRELDHTPTSNEIAREFPSIWLQSGNRAFELALAHAPPPLLQSGNFRDGWQCELATKLENDPVDDRKIDFYVDPTGGLGKSWFVRKYLSIHPDSQLLGVGKRDDLAHAIDEKKRVFFLMVPRTQMEFLNYSILEMLKDRMIFSPKYASRTKVLDENPHVVVFSNEMPNVDKLTEDRYNIIELS